MIIPSLFDEITIYRRLSFDFSTQFSGLMVGFIRNRGWNPLLLWRTINLLMRKWKGHIDESYITIDNFRNIYFINMTSILR